MRPTHSIRNGSARLGLALALLAALAAATPTAAYQEPQARALEQLRKLSQTPLDARFEGGFPRSLRLDVAAPAGVTPTARARAFLTQWQDVFSQNHPDLALHPIAAESAEQEVVAFYQTYRGIPVFGGQIAVGMGQPAAGGPTRIRFTAGWLLPAFPNIEDVEIVPCVTPQMAEDAARLALGRLSAPVIGETALMLFSPAALDSGDPHAPVLVYRVTLGGGDAMQLLVDAETLEVVFQHALVFDGPGLSDYEADFEDANGGTMSSTNCFNPTTIDDDIGSEDGLIAGYLDDPEAVALWWHTRDTYLAYHDQLGRHSWDDDDGELVVYTHIGLSASGNPNANYSPGCDAMQFHDVYVGLDVVGHEFTHGVISHSISNLVYQDQSGALNEAFADAMAALVVDPADWLLAEGLLNGGGPIRSMADPLNGSCESAGGGDVGTCNQPDRWSLFVTTNGDNGGVHTNSGIQNKATFLMADGGSFNGRSVVGMGRPKASHLLYFLTRYLQPSTANFVDARNFAIATAQTFVTLGYYGFTATDVCTVRNAYAAVEIGQQGDADCDGVVDNSDDGDADGVYDTTDNCPNASNPSQTDFDEDGIGDACDGDGDNDGIPTGSDLCPQLANSNWYLNGDPDGDGLGRACDPDDDNDGVLDNGGPAPCTSGQTTGCDDNCAEDYNPTQFDGNANGEGDACDPDQDGDGLYVEDDNCTFVANPGQENADGDEYGDACDDCPNDEDLIYAYTPGIPELGIPPQPYQPDTDGDGIPDVCDSHGFGEVGVVVDGRFSSLGVSPKPDGSRRAIEIVGPAGGSARIPIDVCDPDGDPDGYASSEYVELAFEGLLPAVRASIVDDSGNRYGLSTRSRVVTGGADRGFRFKPRCDHNWFLLLELGPDFPGAESFTLVPRVVPGGGGTDNPWTSIAETIALPPPDSPADGDRDGAADVTDNCPLRSNPEQYDADGDNVGDVCDNCSKRANPNQLNTNRDPYGNVCDPDYNGDGRVGIPDFNLLRAQFGKRSGVHADFDPNVDHNGDGVIGLPDFNVLRSYFGSAPGPAGALP